MQILDALDRYLLQLEADGRSKHTIAQARRHGRLFATWAALAGLSGEVGELGHEDVVAFMGAPAARTRPDGRAKKPTSVNAMRSSLRAFFRYLQEAGHVGANPARILRRARCGVGPPRGLTEAAQQRLLAALAAGKGWTARRDHVLFSLMLATGLRVGEALALDVGDFDLEQGQVWIRDGKGAMPGRVFVGEELVRTLEAYLADKPAGPAFEARWGGRLTVRQARRRLARWLHAAEVRAGSPHALRHSFAAWVYGRSRDLLLTKEAMRHRSVESTMVYARASEADLRSLLANTR